MPLAAFSITVDTQVPINALSMSTFVRFANITSLIAFKQIYCQSIKMLSFSIKNIGFCIMNRIHKCLFVSWRIGVNAEDKAMAFRGDALA